MMETEAKQIWKIQEKKIDKMKACKSKDEC
jgi:hypothetical protein